MKYAFIASLAIIPFFGLASHAAAAGCGDVSLNHPEIVTVTSATSTDPITGDEVTTYATSTTPAVDFSSCAAGSPEFVTSAWGRNGDVPKVKPGATVTDQWGFSYVCPAWFSQPCVDITHTAYYRVMMQPILKLFGLK